MHKLEQNFSLTCESLNKFGFFFMLWHKINYKLYRIILWNHFAVDLVFQLILFFSSVHCAVLQDGQNGAFKPTTLISSLGGFDAIWEGV